MSTKDLTVVTTMSFEECSPYFWMVTMKSILRENVTSSYNIVTATIARC